MIRKILLPTIFATLMYGFWISPDFKEIAAGVAIFLFGMLFLEEGFRAFTGGILEAILRRTTDKLWKSLGFGVLTTTIMQSSSLVSVITISFLSAGLIGLSEGIGIIFGANLGTTTGAWLVAGLGLKVKISAYAMPMLVFGIILVFQKSKTAKGFGYVLAGLGFLFLGIHYMKEGFEAFKSSIDLAAYAVPGFKGLIIFTLIGIFATVVMQSSHATLVLIITALASQQITYENALALAIGANVGTTITAIIGAMSSNVEGRRLAGAHLIFNAVTGAIAILFIQQFLFAVNAVSEAFGIAEDDYTLKLAVFHTLFNLVGVLVMLPFTNRLVHWLQRILKGEVKSISEPHYLNDAVLEMPDTAVEAMRNETRHLFDNAFHIIARALNLSPTDLRSHQPIEAVLKETRRFVKYDIDTHYERRVKTIHGAIVAFASRAQANHSAHHKDALFALRQASQDIVEAVKDIKHLQKNMVYYLNHAHPEMRREYQTLRQQLGSILRELSDLAQRDDLDLAMLSLDGLKLSIEQNDIQLNSNLDQLIRQNQITPQMATSLMNDSAYAYDVAQNLVAMARVLFASSANGIKGIENSIILDDNELEEVLYTDTPHKER